MSITEYGYILKLNLGRPIYIREGNNLCLYCIDTIGWFQ